MRPCMIFLTLPFPTWLVRLPPLNVNLRMQTENTGIMSHRPNPAPTLQAMMRHLSEVRSNWFVFGIALGVPISKLRAIETSRSQEGVGRWMAEMLQYWLDTTPMACWQQVAAALEQIDMIALASTIKLYHKDSTPSDAVRISNIEEPVLLVQMMMQHLCEVPSDVWVMFGIALGVPLPKLKSIEDSYPEEGVQQWIAEMLKYWLQNTTHTSSTACWKQVAAALEQIDLVSLASRIKQCDHWESTTVETNIDSCMSLPHSFQESTTEGISTPLPNPLPESSTAEINIDGWTKLGDLERAHSLMLTNFRTQLKGCNVSHAQLLLNRLLDTNAFTDCDTIGKILNQLCHNHVDTFNVYALQKFATRLDDDYLKKLVDEYEEKKEILFTKMTVLEFQKAVVCKPEPDLPTKMVKITFRIPRQLAKAIVIKEIENLALQVFEDNQQHFVRFHVTPGPVIIVWYVTESLCEVLQRMAQKKATVWRQHGVEEVTVGSHCVFLSTAPEKKTATRYSADTTYVLNTAKRTAEEMPSLYDMVQEIGNNMDSAIKHIKYQCASAQINEGSAAVRLVCHELQSVVENARQYYGAIKDFVAKVPDKENIREIVQFQACHQQPFEDLIDDLKQSLDKVKQCYSEFAYACSRAISEAGKAAEFSEVKATVVKNKRRISQVAFGIVTVATFAAIFVFFMNLSSGKHGGGGGTLVAIIVSSLFGAGVLAFTVIATIDDTESSVRFLQDFFVSLQSTIPNMELKVKHFHKSLEIIDHKLARRLNAKLLQEVNPMNEMSDHNT